MTGDTPPAAGSWRAAFSRVDAQRAVGLAVGTLAALASLTPSLLPRPAVFQGALGALSFLLGYALGVLVARGVERVLERVSDRESTGASDQGVTGASDQRVSVGSRKSRIVRRGIVVAAALILASLVSGTAVAWQNEVREAVEMPPLDGVAVGSLVGSFLVVLALGWGIALGFRWLTRRLTRTWGTGRGLAAVTAFGVALVLVIGVGAVATVDRIYADLNASADGVTAPTSALRSGGPESLVAWESLGRHGSAFVSGGPTVEDISTLTGIEATEPVRVYVGQASAPTLDERVALAVAELERTGAFDREVLVVATTTGSGWVEPQTMDAIEYLHGGDTAIVTMQYAYTPSWVSFLFDPDAPIGTARALFTAVEQALADRPVDERPRLISYGLSLGAHGSQAIFADVNEVQARTDGAMFVGSPNGSELWRTLQSTRDAGSPAWQPTRDDGRVVRWISQPADLATLTGPWESPRVLYLQHPTDPVTWLGPELLWRSPEWLRAGERGPGISDAMTWFPVITALQVTVDMLMGESVPARHGHNYGDVVVDGWRAVTGDAGLDEVGLDAVRAEIASYPYAEETD